MNKIDNIESVIEQITQKVAQKLQQATVSTKKESVVSEKIDYKNTSQFFGKKTSTPNQHSKNVVEKKVESTIDSYTLARMIDHTLLKPNATQQQLAKVCQEAIQHNFATVCVNSSNIPYVASLLQGSVVLPIAVIGFPLGAASTEAKVFEAKEAIRTGAREIDMVINIGALKSKNYFLVYQDILAVVEASKPYKVKVILEMSELNHDEKVIACTLSKTAKAAFVKTSTGFSSGGATLEDIALMRAIVGKDMEVKASGGVNTREIAEKMIAAGANRIGTSSGVSIVTGVKTESKGY